MLCIQSNSLEVAPRNIERFGADLDGLADAIVAVPAAFHAFGEAALEELHPKVQQEMLFRKLFGGIEVALGKLLRALVAAVRAVVEIRHLFAHVCLISPFQALLDPLRYFRNGIYLH